MIDKDNLILVGNKIAMSFGGRLTSIKQIETSIFRFNCLEYDEFFYFEMTESEINEELESINKTNKEMDEYLKTIE